MHNIPSRSSFIADDRNTSKIQRKNDTELIVVLTINNSLKTGI